MEKNREKRINVRKRKEGGKKQRNYNRMKENKTKEMRCEGK